MDTQISLSPDLVAKLEREAGARGLSLAELVRESLEWAVVRKPWNDPMFSDDAVFDDAGPTDFAARHDDYLLCLLTF